LTNGGGRKIMQKRYFIFGILLLSLLLVDTLTGETAIHPAVETVGNLHATLLAVMKEGPKIAFKDRFDRLAPVITMSFDLPFIAKAALGNHWDTVDASSRSRFVEVFSRLSIATYAANFDSYSGERFKILSEKVLDHGRIQVKSQIIRSVGGEVSLDYILRPVDRQWRIINVIANGVSDLALKRADYNQFLKTKGFDALLDKLNEKITQYSR
jgi:phospholipid transport system substrate-binding protein